MPKGYKFTLLDIGLVMNQLMGSGYRSSYTRRKFRLRYEIWSHHSQQQRDSPTRPRTFNPMLSRTLHKAYTENSLKVSGPIQ
jgi:hypothetical protein